MPIEHYDSTSLHEDRARAHLHAEGVIREGVVSVILVNYKGAQDTISCLRAFAEIDWPAVNMEFIVVDNDSGDGSLEVISSAFPQVRVVETGANLGFAGGCNVGVDVSTGEFVAFINNDARPHSQWIRSAVKEFDRDASIGAVASKVLDWSGERIDFVDASLTWFGMGYKREVERADNGSWQTPKDVLYGTGAALFIRSSLFRAVGGFDERFFMFYEDVDLGWRLNLLGSRVRYVPESIAYHRHHATMKKFGSFREQYLLERNALVCMLKNYSDETLARTLPAALGLVVTRTGGLSSARLNIDEGRRSEQSKMALAGVYAIDFVTENLPDILRTRSELQNQRVRPDRELIELFRYPLEQAFPGQRYSEAYKATTELYGLPGWFVGAAHVLVVTGEPLAARLAGPAIRAWEMAKALARSHPVRLVSTANVADDVPSTSFEIVNCVGPELKEHTDWADVIVFQGFLLEGAPWLLDSDKIIVADIYDPMHLEQLEQAKDLGPSRRREAINAVTDVLNRQLARADHFLCASDKQRDFWSGQLAVQGRLNASTMGEDGSLDKLISVVPFGIDDDAAVQRRHGLRGAVPGIGFDDRIIVWGGGIYNWFDPLTLIRAVSRLSQRHDDVRLFFMGLKHPNPGVPEMKIAWKTQQLSDELGLTGKHVFFNKGWVPYNERADVLMDADLGVSTHFEHVETAYSFRTRILDYLWAGLPIVATMGDSFGNILDSRGLGRSVPPEDVEALEAALEEMLYDEPAVRRAREKVREFSEQYRWSKVLGPVVQFCADPHRAADLAARYPTGIGADRIGRSFPGPATNPINDVGLILNYFRQGGVREVLVRAGGRIRRKMAS